MNSKDFQRAFALLLKHEGGYVNHKDDPGGETNHGITAAVARDHGYLGDMKDLPVETAKEIAFNTYWPHQIPHLSFGIKYNIFDGNYHSGKSQSTKWAQRVCGGLKVDGIMGPKTRGALAKVDNNTFVTLYNTHRLEFLADLGTFLTFGRGWTRRIVDNIKETLV